MCQIVSNDKAWTCSYFRTVRRQQRCNAMTLKKCPNFSVSDHLISRSLPIVTSYFDYMAWSVLRHFVPGLVDQAVRRRTDGWTDRQDYGHPLNSGDFLDYLFDNFINRCFDTVSIHWQSEVWGEQKRSATFALE